MVCGNIAAPFLWLSHGSPTGREAPQTPPQGKIGQFATASSRKNEDIGIAR